MPCLLGLQQGNSNEKPLVQRVMYMPNSNTAMTQAGGLAAGAVAGTVGKRLVSWIASPSICNAC